MSGGTRVWREEAEGTASHAAYVHPEVIMWWWEWVYFWKSVRKLTSFWLLSCHWRQTTEILQDYVSFADRMRTLYHSSSAFLYLFMFRQPLEGLGLPIVEASRSHSDAPHLIGLWTSDRPDAETSTWQHTAVTRDRYPCSRRDSNPQFQQASGRRPTR